MALASHPRAARSSGEVDLKRKSLNRIVIRILLGIGPWTLLALPLSCGDSSSGPSGDASSESQEDSPLSESGPTGDAASGVDATRGADGAGDARTGTDADAATNGDGTTADSDAGPQCPPPADPTKAQACLTFDPETIHTLVSNALLDGQGQLLIQVFDTSTPFDTASQPIVPAITYPPASDAGPQEVGVYSLPTVPIDGLPATVYILTYFIDNSLWFQTRQGLTYGMFVGGLDLSMGVQPMPPILAVNLTAGQSTVVSQHLTALRRFQTRVTLTPPSGGAPLQPAGNGQGPLAVRVYEQASPAGAAVFGGIQYPCVDTLLQSPFAVTGFFYNGASGSVSTWFGAQLDDFGVGGASPGGALVSLVGGAIPDSQSVSVASDQYDVLSGQLPQITLSTVLPGAPGSDSISCHPTSADGGSDAASDGPGGG
jgi:hypothetical protein